MPRVSATALLQVALLLSAVPAQYYISRWYGTTATQRFHATARLLRIWKDLRSSYLSATAWAEWGNLQLSKVTSFLGFETEANGFPKSLKIERMIIDNDQGYFGASKTVRKPRPPYVFLRVGDVVLETRNNMVGVVISWDHELTAPSEWVNRQNYEGIKAEKTPHYKILFNGPAASSITVAYLPQTQLERVTGMRPNIPTLDKYFTHFDGAQFRFVMQPWLRAIFPED
ncbi:hypothetical protein WMY93_015768 [Mugilogobius chulae]|uniref:Hemimethylated DNA-binding domain-containing protein n=1 Tax=Mugilogobius chulae TaxID=88201 RepID=A0AAW0P1E8_9GOBI